MTENNNPNWDRCLCHVRDATGTLPPFSETSWKKFKECSRKRLDEIWFVMQDHWNEGPRGFYHRQCYQKYTNITYLSRKEAIPSTFSTEKDAVSSCTLQAPAKRLRSHDIEFNRDKCIICQKDKVIKGAQGHALTRELLTLNINKDASFSLLRAAQIRGTEQGPPPVEIDVN